MATIERTPRDLLTRTQAERPTKWSPPQLLPDPNPEAGYGYRWIRISTLNAPDAINITAKFREGWEPVKASMHPEITMLATADNKYPDSIEIGGLLLCKTPTELIEQRDQYYRNIANGQMESVDNSYMKDSDPRMRKFNERQSKVTFGTGN